MATEEPRKTLAEEKERLLIRLKVEGWLKTPSIIKAFGKVPRELFVKPEDGDQAYLDIPLHIGFGQTVSQPLTVAAMLELLQPHRGQKILDIGAGSGYKAAILAEIVGHEGKVYSIEVIPELAKLARKNLDEAGYENVEVITGDGSQGLKEYAPFDRIIAGAAAPNIPKPLKDQLKVGGRLVLPVGRWTQKMTLVTRKSAKQYVAEENGEFRFVPMAGKYGFGPWWKK